MCTENKLFLGGDDDDDDDEHEGNRIKGEREMKEKKAKENAAISQGFPLQIRPFKFKTRKDIYFPACSGFIYSIELKSSTNA
jgi:hypothetical protein